MSWRPGWDTQWVPGFHELQRKTVSKKSGGKGVGEKSHCFWFIFFILKVNFFFRILKTENDTEQFPRLQLGSCMFTISDYFPASLSANRSSVYLCTGNGIIKGWWQGSEDTVQWQRTCSVCQRPRVHPQHCTQQHQENGKKLLYRHLLQNIIISDQTVWSLDKVNGKAGCWGRSSHPAPGSKPPALVVRAILASKASPCLQGKMMVIKWK